MQKFKVNGESVPKIEWKETDGQTDGRTEASALPPTLMRSVKMPCADGIIVSAIISVDKTIYTTCCYLYMFLFSDGRIYPTCGSCEIDVDSTAAAQTSPTF